MLFCAWFFVALLQNTSANNCTDDISLLQILHQVTKRVNRVETSEMGMHVLHGGPATKFVLEGFYAALRKDMEVIVDSKKECEDGLEARIALCQAVYVAFRAYNDITMRLQNWVTLADDPNFAYVYATLTTSPEGHWKDFVGGVGLYSFTKEMVDAEVQLGFTKFPWVSQKEYRRLWRTSPLDAEEMKHAVYQQLPDLGFAFMIGIFKLPRYRRGLSSLFPDSSSLIDQTVGFADAIVNGVTGWFSSLPGPMDGVFVPTPIGSMPEKLLQFGFAEVSDRWVEKSSWTWLARNRVYNRLLWSKMLEIPAEGAYVYQPPQPELA